MKLLTILYKLFRFRPTIAWSFCGILLGIAVAIHEYGFNLMWSHILIAVVPIILLQGFIAHAINDLEDEDVDRKTDLIGTNRFKVLVSGIATRYDLILIAAIIWSITLLAAITLYKSHGYPIAIFYIIALYAAFGYSLPPLKLGWRPYSEWTIVFPILVTLVVAVNYIATGSLSYLAFIIGIQFALFNIVWFLVSRMMDYEPDKAVGKITTFVKLGLYYKNSCFNGNVHPYLVILLMMLFLFIVYIGFFINSIIGVVLWFNCFVVSVFIPNIYELEPQILSIARKNLIYISIINSISISIILIFT
jgi:1,4-dihydroxy-2-naphthoate octaprenyltransferase